jgi:hypothetical protein
MIVSYQILIPGTLLCIIYLAVFVIVLIFCVALIRIDRILGEIVGRFFDGNCFVTCLRGCVISYVMYGTC